MEAHWPLRVHVLPSFRGVAHRASAPQKSSVLQSASLEQAVLSVPGSAQRLSALQTNPLLQWGIFFTRQSCPLPPRTPRESRAAAWAGDALTARRKEERAAQISSSCKAALCCFMVREGGRGGDENAVASSVHILLSRLLYSPLDLSVLSNAPVPANRGGICTRMLLRRNSPRYLSPGAHGGQTPLQ